MVLELTKLTEFWTKYYYMSFWKSNENSVVKNDCKKEIS